MSLTLTQLRTAVRALTKEPYPSSPVFATDANTLLFANEGQLEVASRSKSRTFSNAPNSTAAVSSDVTTASQPLYSYNASLLDIFKVVVNKIVCYPATFEALSGADPEFWRQTGQPTTYYIRDLAGVRKIGLWPTPGTSSWPILMIGTKRPTDLSGASDVIDLDERLHMTVVFYVCWRVEEIRREMGMAGYFKQQYEESLQKYMSSGMDTNQPIPFMADSCPSD
jgi:hypothetical protein